MNVVFVHQNMPGQFLHLARWLAHDPAHKVAFVTRRSDVDAPNILRVTYDLKLPPMDAPVPMGAHLRVQSLYGEGVVRALKALLQRSFKPDVIVGHPGWGELLFVKDLLPDTPLISYCEYYNSPAAPLTAGDPPKPPSLGRRMDLRAQSAHLLLSLEAADRGWSPTAWQRSLHPASMREKIEVIFDGVDTDVARPDAGATFALNDGRRLTSQDEVITFTARSLEPSRGFMSFMHALPDVLRRRPNAQVVIAGSPQPHYDLGPEGGGTWLEFAHSQVKFDEARVHFVGALPHRDFIRLLQISGVHIHLTRPGVLSWSLVEALSCGCLVVASDAPPARGIVAPNETALLTTFGDARQIASDIDQALNHPEAKRIRLAARQRVELDLSLNTCVPQQIELLKRMAVSG